MRRIVVAGALLLATAAVAGAAPLPFSTLARGGGANPPKPLVTGWFPWTKTRVSLVPGGVFFERYGDDVGSAMEGTDFTKSIVVGVDRTQRGREFSLTIRRVSSRLLGSGDVQLCIVVAPIPAASRDTSQRLRWAYHIVRVKRPPGLSFAPDAYPLLVLRDTRGKLILASRGTRPPLCH